MVLQVSRHSIPLWCLLTHRKTCGEFCNATFLLGVGEVDIYNILKARPEGAFSTRSSSEGSKCTNSLCHNISCHIFP